MKLVAFIKEGADRFISSIGNLIDSFSSGGTPFTPIPLPPPFSPGAIIEYDGMRAQQDYAYRQALGAQQGGYMGGFGDPLFRDALLGMPPGSIVYPYSTGKPKSILEEGKVSVQVTFKRVDKEHVLVQVECIQRIVHNKEELRKVTTDLITEYAEGYVFGEQPKATQDMCEVTAKEPPGAIREVGKK